MRTDKPATASTDTEEIRSNAAAEVIAFNNRGAAYAKSGDYDKALVELLHAAELNPKEPAIQVNLSVVLDRLNRFEEAREAAGRAVELAPDDPRARLQFCDLSILTGRSLDAVLCYSRLEEMGPLDSNTKANYALALLGSNQPETARKYLEEAVKADPYNVAAANALGVILIKKKEYSKAAEIFKRAVETDPRNSDARYNLGMTELMMGNKPAAISQYRLLNELSPAQAKQLYRLIHRDKLLFVDDK